MIISDLHTHTKYCDGADTPEAMVKSAIEKGVSAIGISSHAPTSFDESYAIKREDVDKYINEISALKEKYKNKIEILCGVEMDYYSDIKTDKFDYVIGSVHFVYKDGKYLEVDFGKERFTENINRYYNGDYFEFIKDYYKTVSDLNIKINPDIIGHIDLVTKFNEGYQLFDENDERYLSCAYEAIENLCEKETFFEINTGAISRGYRSEPYPSCKLLEKIRDCGGKLIINSDSHSKNNIAFGFDQAVKTVKMAGFNKIYTIKNKEFISVNI